MQSLREYIDLLESKKPPQIEIDTLSYKIGDLAPILSEENVDYHYNVLSKGYATRYNNGEGDPDFNLGGAKMHNLFWQQLKPSSGLNSPKGQIKDLIESKFENINGLQEAMIKEAMTIQGSGWVYLSKKAEIKTTPNQSFKSDIVMPLDMWEHSFTDYFSARKEAKKKYIKSMFKIIDWQIISDRFYSK